MNKYRKKYQNVVEKKNRLSVVSRDHNSIESLENQALDAFGVESSSPDWYMQRMGQLRISPLEKRRYNLKNYNNEVELLFQGIPRIIPKEIQTMDNFMIQRAKRPDNIVQRPIHFNIFQMQKKLNNMIESLNELLLPATGRFFLGRPVLEIMNNPIIEYLKIRAPFECENTSNLFLELQPKKTKYVDLDKSDTSSLIFILKKVQVFNPSSTILHSESTLLIPPKPKKTRFTDLIQNKEFDEFFESSPKMKLFNDTYIESMPDVFIPELPKRRYYSIDKADELNIPGSIRPEFCLEVDPNEEIFVSNVYDMLLVQNYWDDLSVNSFRMGYKPRILKNRNLEIVSNKNLYEKIDEIKPHTGEKNLDGEKDQDKDVLKEFSKQNKNILKNNNEKVNLNIYEDKTENENNPADIKPEAKTRESKAKGVRFKYSKKKLV